MTVEALAFVDGQAISARDMPDALARIDEALDVGTGFTVFTLNMDHLVKRRQNAAFRALYARATIVTADGWPVVKLARRDGPDVKRTTGADLVIPVCRLAARRGTPVYLCGSSDAILARAAARLQSLCPGLRIVGREAPPYGFDPTSEAGRAAAARIADSGAGLCFVALGAPKQEVFADLARDACPKTGFLCIGAALDFIAGAQMRAPARIQSLGLEWAWRLAMAPLRLGPRYVQCGVLLLRLAFSPRRRQPVA